MCLGVTGLMTAGNAGCSSSNNNSSSSSSGGASSSSGGSSGGSSSGTSSSSGSTGSITPPAQPSGPATAITTATNFALHDLHLGDETGNCANGTNWCQYGYNIDGLITSATSTNVCAQASDSPKANQTDGNGGIDNSFGENIVPLIAAVEPNPSSVLSASIQAGSFTLMMDVTGIDPSSAGTTQTATGLKGAIFGGSHFNQAPNTDASVPTFMGTDDWPLTASFITSTVGSSGALTPPVTSNVNFTNPYMAAGTFVSGTGTDVTLALTLSGIPLSIPIKDAVITFQNNGPTQPNGKAGIISGVILVNDLISALTPVAGQIATSFCPQADGGVSAAFEQIIVAIQQSADIMHDGTNVAGTPCDSISIGLGFDADQIGAPQFEGTAGPPTNTCAPAGDDGG
jgi:hypothetical protein